MLISLSTKARSSLGFTIIELLVVVIVVMLLIGLLVPTLGFAKHRARTQVGMNNLSQIGKSIQSYTFENGGLLPLGYNNTLGQETDWEKLAAPADGQPGKVKASKTYKLEPGDAYVYNEGDLHSPRRESSTKLIRFEGVNTETIQRYRFEAI